MKHGLTKTPEYRVWHAMKQRCLNKNSPLYKWYGGRGIKVCDRWRDSFENFIIDMGSKPSPEMTIERLDVNGDYEPLNCIWLPQSEQYKNRRPRSTHPRKFTPGTTGTTWNKTAKKWQSMISINNKNLYLGTFETRQEAHDAYLQALKEQS